MTLQRKPGGEWTEGVCEDGAAILYDGQPFAIADLLAWLNEADALIERVRAAVAAEREACAKVADEQSDPLGSRDVYDQVAARTATQIAAAIRARGET